MSHRSVSTIVPFVPLAVGLAASTLAFREDDALAGLAFGLGGFLLMLVLAAWLGRRA